jgi:hypothetical protein
MEKDSQPFIPGMKGKGSSADALRNHTKARLCRALNRACTSRKAASATSGLPVNVCPYTNIFSLAHFFISFHYLSQVALMWSVLFLMVLGRRLGI